MKNKLEIDASEQLIERMKDVFDLEVEFLEAEKEILANGQIRCTIFVDDHKMIIIKDFINQLISLPTNKIKAKIGGIELHKN